MAAMRALLIAIVSYYTQNIGLSSHATRTVAYDWAWLAALRIRPCVRTAETWLTAFAMASVTLGSQDLRTRIGGLVL